MENFLIYLTLGSNILPENNISLALEKLNLYFGGLKKSRLYFTFPIDKEGKRLNQSEYINLVVAFEKKYTCEFVREKIFKIEEELGRKREEDKFSPRTIDIDITLFGDEIYIENGKLKIPDPDILKRPWIPLGIMDISGNIKIPFFNMEIKEILSNMNLEMIFKIIKNI